MKHIDELIFFAFCTIVMLVIIAVLSGCTFTRTGQELICVGVCVDSDTTTEGKPQTTTGKEGNDHG